MGIGGICNYARRRGEKMGKGRRKPVNFTIEKLNRGNDETIILSDPSISPASRDRFLPDQLPEELSALLYQFFLPIFLKKGTTYKPIARQWVIEQYAQKGDEKVKEDQEEVFYAIVFTDKALSKSIREYDQEEFRLLCGATGKKGKKKSVHLSTNKRRDAKTSKKTCPFCKGPATRKIGHNNPWFESSSYTIGCDYSSNSAIRCKFSHSPSDEQTREYRAGKLTVKQLLQRIPDQWCPDCQDDLYYITPEKGRRVIACRKWLINDSPYFSREEFKLGKAQREKPLSPRRLCMEIFDAKLPHATWPKRPMGLAWLNDILQDPVLYNSMQAAGMLPLSGPLADLAIETAESRSKSADQRNDDEREALMKLNRLILENRFSSAPKLYLPDGNICKYIDEES